MATPTPYNFPIIKRENFISEATDEEKSDDDGDDVLGDATVDTAAAANIVEDMCVGIIVPEVELKPDIKVKADIDKETETQSFTIRTEESEEISKWYLQGADRECLMCDRVFLYPNELLNHMRTHTGEKPFKCQFCGREHAYKKALLKHIRFHHSRGEKSVKGSECSICGKMIADLTEHFRRVHSQIKRVTCPDCGKGFFKPMDLKRHLCSRRNPGPDQPQTLQLRQCNICLKTFRRIDYLNAHKLLHFQNADVKDEDGHNNEQNNLDVQDVKPVYKLNLNKDTHVCHICNQIVSTAQSLQRHIKNIHENDKSEKKFKCSFNSCQKSFRQNCDLQRHLKCHTGEKSFKCDTCSKLFSLKGGLTQHKRHCSNTNSG